MLQTVSLLCEKMLHCSPPRPCVTNQVIKLKNIPAKEHEACRNEVELLRRMCHPNIVGYTNSFLYKNCLCIIMEYCDAGDLGDRVNEAKASRCTHAQALGTCGNSHVECIKLPHTPQVHYVI